jgi:phage major head subunit gpT-like protein
MLITATSLEALRTGFRNDFNKGLTGVKPQWEKVATRVPSTTASNTYGWLEDWPRLREWIGDRVVKSLSEKGQIVKNRGFEATVGVKRNAIEDDEFGIYSPMMQSMGQSAAEFPDELVFSLLAAGFDQPCYDGQNFFDAEHPVGDAVYSNFQAGAAAPWFLLDTSRPLKPLIYQDRKKPEFVAMTKIDDEAVFSAGEFRYGVDMRCNAGFGFYQMGFGSKAVLSQANYEAAFQAMTSQKTEDGRPLNIRPTAVVVGPGNRAAAKALFDAMLTGGGNSNVYYKDVEIVETPWAA